MKRRLDMSKLKRRKRIVVSSGEALKDVIHIGWSKEVTSGKKKVTISGCSK